jgi:hypothetical protein
MNATEYLSSLGIELKRLANERVGRLSVAAEFYLDAERGVLVRPKRGSISDRYLELLAEDESLAFIVVESRDTLAIYGRVGASSTFNLLHALPVGDPTRFPTEQVLAAITLAVDAAVGRKVSNNEAVRLASALFAAKIDDERGDNSFFGRQLARGEEFPPVLEAIQAVLADAKSLKNSSKALLSAAALLAGYRIDPINESELLNLIECVAGLGRGREPLAGLPGALAFALSGPWTKGRSLAVCSNVIGAQLLPVWKSERADVCLPKALEPTICLLSRILPNARFHHGDFLEWKPNQAPDRVFVSPPLGTQITSSAVLSNFESPKRSGGKRAKASAESLFLEHAIRVSAHDAILVAVVPEGLLASVAHSAFRKWLLEQVRVLAVLALPTGSCFPGTGIRCSLLYLQKVKQIPSDYPILMAEALEEDIHDASTLAGLKSAIDDAVGREVGECA